MTFFNRIIFLVFALISLADFSWSQENPWVLKRNLPDLKVYFRDAPDSGIKELKMNFTVEASLSTIVSVLADVPGFANWVYKLEESYLIENVSETEMYYYNLVDFPWPLSDRDFIAHSLVSQDPATKVITIQTKGIFDKKEEIEDVVRLKTMTLKYIIQPNGDGTAHIEYFLKTDPAGNLPNWLINLALDQGPVQTIKKFKKVLKEEPYKNASLPYIQE